MAAVDIANLACDDLKVGILTALSDDTNTGRMMNRQYSVARDELLSSYPWAFALTRAQVDGNVLPAPKDLNNTSYWTASRCTITANAAEAPDGTMTADKIVEDNTAGNTHVVSQAYTVTAGRVYKGRARFKYVDRQYAHVSFLGTGGFGSGHYAIFDIQNGEIAAQSGTFVEDTPKITILADGWYECEIAAVAATTASAAITFGPSGAASTSYDGDAASSVYAWKLQLIERLYPEHTWTYKWALPTDCLSFWKIEDQSVDNPHKIEGGYIHTEEESLDILYFKQETDTAKFHPLFTAALVKLLAWKCAYALTGSAGLRDQIKGEYMECLMQARAVNAILAGTPDEIVSDTFIAARY